MRMYSVMNADETGCYTHGHTDKRDAILALVFAKAHDPEAHIVELDVETLDEKIERLEAELEAANEREKGLSIMLTSAQSAAEKYKRERDQYWDYIKGMECESCSGDCDKCDVTRDGFTGWEWSGDELSENADS